MQPYKCICGEDRAVCPDCMQDWIDLAEDKLNQIKMALDSISTSNMRHVLNGIRRIIDA